ncbi:hypothetical protein Tco_1018977 [Tanacetum coccineum]|uniref:Uncharacterized protein n=1 Tax=Tanacetum coccineum TaxID=301880 RepID=A0ABQ5FXR6_9ASTR
MPDISRESGFYSGVSGCLRVLKQQQQNSLNSHSGQVYFICLMPALGARLRMYTGISILTVHTLENVVNAQTTVRARHSIRKVSSVEYPRSCSE